MPLLFLPERCDNGTYKSGIFVPKSSAKAGSKSR